MLFRRRNRPVSRGITTWTRPSHTRSWGKLEKVHVGKGTREKRWRMHYIIFLLLLLFFIFFFFLFLSFSTSAHFERYPGVLAFTALDRMVGLGLGAFLWGRA
jgi:hypothetical protein